MLPKPSECMGCPLYGDGLGFVPGLSPEGAEVLILGQNPGEEEERDGRPLVGKTGKYLDDTFLPLAGLDPTEVARDNVLRCRWLPPGAREKTNKLPAESVVDEAIRRCAVFDQYNGNRFRLIVAMGALALRKMNPALKQHEWRGHLLPEDDNANSSTDSP